MAPAPVTVIGSYLSPYVRKVLAALHLKGIEYRIDPIVGFMGDDRFSALSPLRRIPVLIDDRQDGGSAAASRMPEAADRQDGGSAAAGRMPEAADRLTLCDSSAIVQYLEDRYPSPSIFPADIFDRARARWLEEYADTRMGQVFIWQLFDQVAIGPYVFGRKTDEAVLRQAIDVDIPHVLDYLESQVPADGFCFGALSVADLSLGVFFRNATFSRYAIDAARWPRTAAYVARVLGQDCLARLRPFEEKMLRTPIAKHREALRELGAPLTDDTYGTPNARPGVMRN